MHLKKGKLTYNFTIKQKLLIKSIQLYYFKDFGGQSLIN